MTLFALVCSVLHFGLYFFLGFILLSSQREKKNLQDLSSVFVFNVAGRDDLDRPTAKLIKEFDKIEGKWVIPLIVCT